MKIKILHNFDSSFLSSVKETLKWAQVAHIGVAYTTYGAFNKLEKEFELFLRRNGKLRILFDIEKFITESKIIEEFATIPGDSECKVYVGSKEIGSFHPKFYLFYSDKYYNAIIGSSNFTYHGILKNIECNLSIYNEKDNFFNDLEEYFNNLWTLENSINVLNNDIIFELYAKIYKKIEKSNKTTNRNLFKLKEQLNSETETIIETTKSIFNDDFAYLLGLISANSKFDKRNRKLTIDLDRRTVNFNNEYEGYYFYPDISDYKISQFDAHKQDIERIKERLSIFFKRIKSKDIITSKHIKDYHFQIYIDFEEKSKIFKELLEFKITTKKDKIESFIPENIFKSEDRKIILLFLMGYCDLKSRMNLSDGVYSKDKKTGKIKNISTLRIGISFPHGHKQLLEGFSELFNKIGIKKFTKTNPDLRDRENMIRIDVRYVPYELIGTHWRRILLKDFQYFIRNKKKNLDLI